MYSTSFVIGCVLRTPYRLLYNTGTLKEGIEEVRKTLPMTKEVEYILNFVENSQRGIIR
jgi:UDP-N-acetylglucosamine acyltransferase